MIIAGGLIGSARRLEPSISLALAGVYPLADSSFSADVSYGDDVYGVNRRWIVICLAYNGYQPLDVAVDGVPAVTLYSAAGTSPQGLVTRFTWLSAYPSGTSGTVTWSDPVSETPRLAVFRLINIDGSSIHDGAMQHGGSAANMVVDIPVGGGCALGCGTYGYSSGGSPSYLPFANMDTYTGLGQPVAAGRVHSTQMTNMDVTFAPSPDPYQCAGSVISLRRT